MATLTFYGATEHVTGSAYLLKSAHATILLECGLVQGNREQEQLNERPFPFALDKLGGVILSHAHLDHSGRLPKLVADGYRGPIFMTHATAELLEIMLKDAAFLEQRVFRQLDRLGVLWWTAQGSIAWRERRSP
jgi:metallo-beta-lactamase family protein